VPARITLAEARSRGADVRVVTSAAGAAALAESMPDRQVVFLAVGFETTACTTAAVVLANPPPNLSFVLSHRLVPPALDALLAHPALALDGFLLPGHVLAVRGTAEYEALAASRGLKMAVAGFEPVDILDALLALVRRVQDDRPGVDNCYGRVVRPEGNPTANALVARVFEPVDAPWRGLGTIPASGQAFVPALRGLDATVRFGVQPDRSLDVPDPACRCDEVLLGLRTPDRCPLFGRACTPEQPHGACMVSLEGTCAAWYRSGRRPGEKTR
jgi:hydrogenase expression/formation protein HypD